ncbi:MAG: hypothetical protein KCHDKBKB_02613 [Elusimicrobia bacterium]|nr:hypothetical protein [Elusimicrobiota bacterium]
MSSNDRRKADRFDTTLEVSVRFMPDGTPIKGFGLEIGPNGMRLKTTIPLVEASYIHISFEQASNNTHCEGRVVWTQRNATASGYESGIDIQKWGGSVPDHNRLLEDLPLVQPKKDRRKTSR